MINHYFLIRRFAKELHQEIKGKTIYRCYSTGINELFFLFSGDDEQPATRLNLFFSKELTLYSFIPQDGNIPKRHERQFLQTEGLKVERVTGLLLERGLQIILENGDIIFLKLFGAQGNVLLIQNSEIVAHFKKNRKAEQQINLEQLKPDLTDNELIDLLNQPEYEKLKSKILAKIPEADVNNWGIYLNKLPNISIANKIPVFTFETRNENTKSFSSVNELLGYFHKNYLPTYLFNEAYNRLMGTLKEDAKKLEKRLSESKEAVISFHNKTKASEIANIIMANLHQIPTGATEVELFDFYRDNIIHIKLNRTLSAQKNAERLYQKSKNEAQQLAELLKYQQGLEAQLLEKWNLIADIESKKTYRELLKFELEQTKAVEHITLPYRKLSTGGFEVWIGKNDKSNDLILRLSHKDDFWLHAKDLTGSHTIIRNMGKTVPNNVLEEIASWAAYYSKGRNMELCTISYTQRKYVRKIKGAAAGKVRFEKEKTILVQPQKPE